jgi:hypothetical protein
MRRPPVSLVIATIVLGLLPVLIRAQCLLDCRYKVPFVITSSASVPLRDYQIKLTINTSALVNAGKMRSDGADIRFTDEGDCCRLIEYYIESGMNTPTTTIWLKIPYVAPLANHYIDFLYGAPTATPRSDPHKVFPIFNDFTTPIQDDTTWTVTRSRTGSNISLEDGIATFRITNDSASGSAALVSVDTIASPAITEMRVVDATGQWPHLAELRSDLALGYGMCLSGNDMGLSLMAPGSDPYGNSVLFSTAPKWQLEGIWRVVWKATAAQEVTWPGGALFSPPGNYAQYPITPYVRVGFGLLRPGAGTLSVDWVRARVYASPEPTISVFGQEQILIPAVIDEQPANQTVCAGEPATLSLKGNGMYYQWRKNGLNVPGATGISYTISSVSPADTGVYDAVVSPGCGPNLISASASLRLYPPTTVVASSSAAVACPGQPVVFSADAKGEALQFQWSRNGVAIPGATGSSYQILSSGSVDVGSYDVAVTGVCGSVRSKPMSLDLILPPAIVQSPHDVDVCRTEPFSLSAEAIGDNISYQWRHNGHPIEGAVGPVYTHVAQPYDSGSYDVVVRGSCEPSVTSTPVHVRVRNEPLVTEQPATQVAAVGNSVTFKVRAAGDNIRYQWQRDGVAIPGATLPFYTIPAVSPDDVGSYNVLLSGGECASLGMVTSELAELVIDAPSQIIRSPESQVVCQGTSITLSVGVTGVDLRYQWRRNGVAITGATARTYRLDAATIAAAGSYDVVVQSASGETLTSTAAVVGVNPRASISGQPADVTVCSGQPARFTIDAAGGDLRYQWWRGDAPIPGATAASYAVAAASVADSGRYRVVVVGGCGDTVTSTIATLAVNSATAITQHPADRSVSSGTPVTFTVGAAGSGLRYQWYKEGVAIAGATSASYEIASATRADEGRYRAVVAGICPADDTSRVARLSVDRASGVPEEIALQSKGRFEVLPQPAHGVTRLLIELPAGVRREKGLRLVLYDEIGRQAIDLTESFARNDYDMAEFDAGELSPGIYQCRVEGGGRDGRLGMVVIVW